MRPHQNVNIQKHPSKKTFRILHISPFNTAGVPFTFVKAEQLLGFESRLITLKKHPYDFEEDICLNAPFITTPGMSGVKKLVNIVTSKQSKIRSNVPPLCVRSRLERKLLKMRDRIWNFKFKSLLNDLDIFSFDLIHLDGGTGIFSDLRIIKQFADRNTPILCTYLGSDLRTRGLIPEVDQLSMCNFTVEFDHEDLYPGIHRVPFPFDFSNFSYKADVTRTPVVIGHAPSVRSAKGTDYIMDVLKRLQNRIRFDILLIENRSHADTLDLKSRCSLFIDQISDLGFGINAIESLAMGIPTITSLVPGYKKLYPEAPFVAVDKNNLEHELYRLIDNPEARKKMGKYSYDWVREHHDMSTVVKQMHRIASGKISGLQKAISTVE